MDESENFIGVHFMVHSKASRDSSFSERFMLMREDKVPVPGPVGIAGAFAAAGPVGIGLTGSNDLLGVGEVFGGAEDLLGTGDCFR